jgi:hypothetical protein
MIHSLSCIGGGNSDKLTLKLARNTKIVTNAGDIKGRARLWRNESDSKINRKIATLPCK